MSAPPRILAIETSGRHGSVAVALGPTLLATRELPAATRHAAELMPAVRDLTRGQSWQPGDIDHIYLSIGPGSFTGLRVAVAAARAIQQATGCKIVAVPSLDVIAQNAPPTFTFVVAMLDAKRDQVFAARYHRDAQGRLASVAPAALVYPADFLQQTIHEAGKQSTATIALTGEGLNHFHPAPQPQVTTLPQEQWIAKASTVHQLGYELASQGLFADPQTLLPLYIRLPEAEEVYRRKHGMAL